LIAGKKLDFAERKEERRSKDMVERFALEHRRIDTQQQQQQQQQQPQQQQLELQQQYQHKQRDATTTTAAAERNSTNAH
jgi:hypothetical protein